jgi:hypothetical protein
VHVGEAELSNLIEEIQAECDRVRRAIPNHEDVVPSVVPSELARTRNPSPGHLTEGQVSIASGDVVRIGKALESLRKLARAAGAHAE